MISRRGMLGGLLVLAAPAIIRPGLLMPVKVLRPEPATATLAKLRSVLEALHGEFQQISLAAMGATHGIADGDASRGMLLMHQMRETEIAMAQVIGGPRLAGLVERFDFDRHWSAVREIGA
jgi:hypothetical protein